MRSPRGSKVPSSRDEPKGKVGGSERGSFATRVPTIGLRRRPRPQGFSGRTVMNMIADIFDSDLHIEWIEAGRREGLLLSQSVVRDMSTVVLMELQAGPSDHEIAVRYQFIHRAC